MDALLSYTGLMWMIERIHCMLCTFWKACALSQMKCMFSINFLRHYVSHRCHQRHMEYTRFSSRNINGKRKPSPVLRDISIRELFFRFLLSLFWIIERNFLPSFRMFGIHSVHPPYYNSSGRTDGSGIHLAYELYTVRTSAGKNWAQWKFSPFWFYRNGNTRQYEGS